MAPEPDTTLVSAADFLRKLRSKTATYLSPSQRRSNFSADNKMPHNQYTRLRWLLTFAGLVLYVVDILTDIRLAMKYFQEKQYVWSGLTLMFVLAGLLVTQVFSYAWYWDDINNVLRNPEGLTTISGMPKSGLILLHLFGLGIFTRFYHLLKKGWTVVWMTTNCYTEEERKQVHHSMFCQATDVSMLKLFEAFLESVPQLLLQIYILMGHPECSFLQYISMAFSFFNISWALVDYRRCLRRSLPHIAEMPSGLPTVVYLLYKLCTITSHILSYSLLLTLSIYSTVALTILWLLGTIWTHVLKTNFCSSIGLELLYRAVTGAILTFTFFNVKGQNTKAAMIIYYIFHFLINIMAVLLLAFLKPEVLTSSFFLTVGCLILVGSVVGLISLVLYYVFLHPTSWREADEVDDPGNQTWTTRKIRNFLQP